jgi:hypothetical protein
MIIMDAGHTDCGFIRGFSMPTAEETMRPV